jgi:glycogen operon protein
MIPEMMTRIYGSSDLFPDDLHESFRPFQSINYVSSHDGFTINDLVSFDQKRNWANGHDNTDGPNDFSWNCGWEGTDNVPPEVMSLRKQQARNYFCLLMLSNGTPMLRMGDEFMRTQLGNNNPYNQDNETTWLDWARLEENRDLFKFVRNMIAFRRSHPTIARSQFWRDDIRWFGAEHLVDMSESSRSLAYFLPGLTESEDDLYVMINFNEDAARFGIHVGSPVQWQCRIDTSRDASERPPSTLSSSGNVFVVSSRSVVVLTRSRPTTQPHPSQ